MNGQPLLCMLSILPSGLRTEFISTFEEPVRQWLPNRSSAATPSDRVSSNPMDPCARNRSIISSMATSNNLEKDPKI
ncbi:hypothetical protein F5884DRAFT_128002 [Xylogone sp. PMI_703]|nr:hypothetical protein F5884DRAFT_128002 [Xylogone sp. PMI_703]